MSCSKCLPQRLINPTPAAGAAIILNGARGTLTCGRGLRLRLPRLLTLLPTGVGGGHRALKGRQGQARGFLRAVSAGAVSLFL